jgi:hypothetical protein
MLNYLCLQYIDINLHCIKIGGKIVSITGDEFIAIFCCKLCNITLRANYCTHTVHRTGVYWEVLERAQNGTGYGKIRVGLHNKRKLYNICCSTHSQGSCSDIPRMAIVSSHLSQTHLLYTTWITNKIINLIQNNIEFFKSGRSHCIYLQERWHNCGNYQDKYISLSLASYKILSNIFLLGLSLYADEITGYHQCVTMTFQPPFRFVR